MNRSSRSIQINGIVQGVGFRPFIYSLALQHHLTGWVRNSGRGVDIEITGLENDLNYFIEAIPRLAPPLAEIDFITAVEIESQSFDGFQIRQSEDNPADFIPVSPDMTICKDCQSELFNPVDRRYRYPFINCTNCGPRFSIIKDIPYDRATTTMSEFEMCAACFAEYKNPLDRRFHAEPVACSNCGPKVWLELDSLECFPEQEEAIQKARKMLKDGKILAIKGLGGFHLVCDASNENAVSLLRARKKRPAKPFALMAFDIETVDSYVFLSHAAKVLLSSRQAPIVLMRAKPNTDIAKSVAPGNDKLGFMLPYTPLHLLLLEPEVGFPKTLVMTSGNLSEEPVIHQNDMARKKLGSIADGFLMHNRPIHRRIDDSVLTVVENKPYPIRRARGYAPNPIRLSETMPEILATGPQMKNTFCLTRGNYAFISHYIGEMENWETFQDYQKAVEDYQRIFRVSPQAIAYDMHPDYQATRYALARAEREKLPTFPIQHHHAHLVACMVENGVDPNKTIAGLLFDGTGYGVDGTIWGGEVLIGSSLEFSRAFHLKPVPLPGGDIAIHKPSRMALSTLWAYQLPWQFDLPPVKAVSSLEKEALLFQLEKQINTPFTSSMGRLFDAVSALIGVQMEISYEAQAAIELETLADQEELGYYPWRLEGQQINVEKTLLAIIDELANGTHKSIISARFHNTIANLSLDLAQRVRNKTGINLIALSGGVWQNLHLLNRTLKLLRQNGFTPIIHHQLPANDECIALGQAIIASRLFQK